MLGYLSLDIICSSKLTVFLELRSRKTVRFSEQIMSADKYPSIFSRQMKTIVYLSDEVRKIGTGCPISNAWGFLNEWELRFLFTFPTHISLSNALRSVLKNTTTYSYICKKKIYILESINYEDRYRQAGLQIEQNCFLCLTKKNDLSSGVECTN